MKQIYQFLLISLLSLPSFLFAQSYTFSGKIIQLNGEAIPNLSISYNGTVTTDLDGKFQFTDIPNNTSYKFSVGEIPGIFDDISILDIIEIRRAILAKDIFNPSQQYASNLDDFLTSPLSIDLDNNPNLNSLDGISTYDLVLMSKLALGINLSSPVDYKLLTTIENPLTKYLLVPNIDLDINTKSDLEMNIVAIKPGDAAVSQEYMFPPNNAPSPVLTVSSEDFKAGEKVQFSVTAKDFTNILGLQQSFEWDPNLLEFESITILNERGNEANLNILNKEHLTEGLLSFLFNYPLLTPLSLDGNVLMKINFKALADAPTNQSVLSINDQLIPKQIVWQNPDDNEIYILEGIYNNALVSSINELPAGLEKLELFPNPTSNELNVKALFQNTTNFEMNIVNVLGQEVFTKKFNEQSLNFSIDLKAIPNGTYFLRLKTADGIQSKTFLKK